MGKNDNIKAMFIFEILGRPSEHVKKTLGELIEKLGELKDIEISNKKIHEPKPVEKEGAEGLFTSFAEVEIIADNLNALLNLVFHAMPSHIEIIEPEELTFKNFDLSSTLSTLTTKLHRYDEIAKTLSMEKNVLINKLKELQGEKEKGAEDKKEDKVEATKSKSKKAKKKTKKN